MNNRRGRKLENIDFHFHTQNRGPRGAQLRGEGPLCPLRANLTHIIVIGPATLFPDPPRAGPWEGDPSLLHYLGARAPLPSSLLEVVLSNQIVNFAFEAAQLLLALSVRAGLSTHFVLKLLKLLREILEFFGHGRLGVLEEGLRARKSM